MNEPQAPRMRTSFAKLDQPLPLPNLIDIQKKSWDWFLSDGLSETIADINPIKDYSEKLLVQFGEHQFGEPSKSLAECRNKDMTFSAPLTMKVAFINEETGEIREQSVFMGDFPMMTDRGTFIIHGTERVVVTQLVRSPGAYIMEPKQAEREKQVLVANLMPQRGSWLELEIDKKGVVNVRIDRKRKFPVSVLLRAMGYGANDELLALFDDSVYIRNTIEKDTTGSQEEALVELFRKQRPGEPPTLDGATAMLKGLFFDPKRYDLSRVGRHKLNVRLHNHIKPADRPDADVRVLVNEDIIELIRRLISLPSKLGVPDDAKDYAADAEPVPRHPPRRDRPRDRRVRALRQPPSAHRRRAGAGRVPHRPRAHGARHPRAPHHRGPGHHRAGDAGQHPAGRRCAQGVLRFLAALAVHGPDQLAVWSHAPPPSERSRRRRPHARARAHRSARRAPDPLRPHVPDRDA